MRPLPLHELHLAARAVLGEEGGAERVLSCGDPVPLALAAREGVALVDLSHRGRFAVVGPDRASWLHGMVTNEINRLAVGAGCLATVLTAKGKLVADARVFKREEELWLDLPGERVSPLLEQLRRFLIMEDCELQDRSAETAMIGLHGPRAQPLLASLAPALPELAEHAQAPLTVAGQPLLAIGSRELGLSGIDLWLSPAACAPVWQALREAGARPIGQDAVELLRIEAGRPRFGAELDEDTLPLEAGLERSISYDKGCYLGQEVIARMTFRGHANRKLMGLWIEGRDPAPPGAPLTRDGKPAGEVRSSVLSPRFERPIALGYVRREQLAPGTVLRLPDGRSATVAALPFELEVPGETP